MEKTLTIDGHAVRFKSTAATPKRFKAQFGKDFFAELMKLMPLMTAFETMGNEEDNIENLNIDLIQALDFDLFYDIIWTLAKTADPTIPEPIDWLDGFSEFPVMELLPKLNDLISASFQGKKKPEHQKVANR